MTLAFQANCPGSNPGSRISGTEIFEKQANDPFEDRLVETKEDFKSWLEFQQKKAIGTWICNLKNFLEYCGTLNPTEEQASGYIKHLFRREKCASTLNNNITAINLYWEYKGWGKTGLKRFRETRRPPTILSVEEAKQYLSLIDNLRDYAVICTLLYGGLRARELCRLNKDDYNPKDRAILISESKNDEFGMVTLHEKACNALNDYLRTRTDDNPALILNRYGRRIKYKSLRQAVEKFAQRFMQRTGNTKRITAHTFRHTIATLLLENDADIMVVKRHLRHKDLRSTLFYLNLSTNKYKELYDKHVPEF